MNSHKYLYILYNMCIHYIYYIVYTCVCVCIKQLNKNEPNFKYGKHTGRCEWRKKFIANMIQLYYNFKIKNNFKNLKSNQNLLRNHEQ